jgi:putative DNA primase/helicase
VAAVLEVVSESPDRSRDLHRVARAVYDAGLTEAHAAWAVQQRADLADRLVEHPDDVARSWAKIDREQRLVHTDKGNAIALVAEYSPNIRFVPEIGKWMHWSGVRWHIDLDTGSIDTAAGQIAADLPGNSQKDRRHRRRSLSASGITAMVRLARSDPMMRVSRDRLDANGWQLNTPNGIVDLRTGEIGDHRPEAWHTRITGVGYDPIGDCPLWKRFLDTTFEDDKELISYVQGLFGYAAIGEVLSHFLPFFWGAGNNGKSVLLEVVKSVLGDYAIPAPANFLLAGRDKHETEIARLAGARFVVCSEINQGTCFDEAKVKLLTGGDTLTGRFMHGNFFNFRLSHTLFLMGNHQPTVGAGGHAFWRRVRLVPFTHQVPEEKRVEGLAEQLIAAEGPAILGWIVAGATTASVGALVTPERVLSATEEYEESEDRIKQFLDDCTTGSTREDRELIGDVYVRYIEWCRSNRVGDPLESRVFAREIYSRGYGKGKSNGKRYVYGLKLPVRGWEREQRSE